MRKTIIKEVIWLAGCLIAAWLSYGFLLGGDALDINMHDTYLPGGGLYSNLLFAYFVFTNFVIIGFWVYFIRALYFSFKIVPTDVILLIFSGLALYFFYNSVFILRPPVFEPPLNDSTTSSPVKGLFYGGSYSSSYLLGTRIMKILLILVLAFTGFMIGRNWKTGVNP